jgi:uncharacterized membrane protein
LEIQMQTTVSLWPLIGVAVIIVGFLLRFNPMLIVAVAAIITGLAAHFPPEKILAEIGTGFIKTRNIPLIILLPLAVIGLLERHGLRERAQAWIGGIKAATAGRLLIVYLLVRELTAAVGLTGLGGHPQMVRPLIAPMAEAAAANRYGELPDAVRQQIRANASAVDNIAVFFGEDIFIAIQSILLIKGFLEQNGIVVEPLQVSVWAIPTAVAALLIHVVRLILLDRNLSHKMNALGRGAAR